MSKAYRLAQRSARPERTVIELQGGPSGRRVRVGADEVVLMAGPCSIESRDFMLEMAALVKQAGGHILRGGAFKPRTSPYSFQGLGVKGLQYLAEARETVGLPIITEVMDTRDVEMIAEVVDVLQIGARNSQNFNLLKAVGRQPKPVLIKRGMSTSIEDLLMSAEYVLAQGNPNVMLCERGIRTFETATRNTLDLSAVPVLQRETHLPVLADPSHGTGQWDLVAPMALASVAAGADGVILEIHPEPEKAFSDGPQALKPKVFFDTVERMRKVAAAIGRSL